MKKLFLRIVLFSIIFLSCGGMPEQVVDPVGDSNPIEERVDIRIFIDEINLDILDKKQYEGQERIIKSEDKSKMGTQTQAYSYGQLFSSNSAYHEKIKRKFVWEYKNIDAQYFYAKDKINLLKASGWGLYKSGFVKPSNNNRIQLVQNGRRIVLYIQNQNGGAYYTFIPDFIKGVAQWGLIPRPLGRLNWGCGGFVPPHTQRFQGEILDTPRLAAGRFIL